MVDLVIGIMRPSGAVQVLGRAAEKLGVPVPPIDAARVERVATVIRDEDGDVQTWDYYVRTARLAIAAADA